ncbi:hypothetical protein LH128_07612 [Sphingomonas sp. LH128]|uniref:hypothetical protein n=1 Tax=Sphingomonas sp. LH128 TaxID=473781 RepID=UPI00027CC4E8|nr:hypothetical protein [Sphingomonas sp. LH128]EJU13663.1 hypothetical protein LH128_07612 [Sphingomonas sp. LH128]
MQRRLTSRPESLEVLLDREQENFDRIMSEIRPGVDGPAHYDELEERVDEMCRRMRAAFRTCRRTARCST